MSEEAYNKMYLMYEDAKEENSYLKKRIEYLERSNNRREDTIISLRDELITTESVLDEIREVINKMIYQGYSDGNTLYFATDVNSEFGVRAKVLLQILDKVK